MGGDFPRETIPAILKFPLHTPIAPSLVFWHPQETGAYLAGHGFAGRLIFAL